MCFSTYRNILLFVAISSVLIVCSNPIAKSNQTSTYGSNYSNGKEMLWAGLELPSPRKDIEVVKHTYYTIGYDEEWEQPAWVAYILTSGMLTKTKERTDNFREDYKVPTGSAFPGDYSGSGYDKGHLCPAGDMTFSSESMSETFYMSNMSPQLPEFNRGIWKKLEGLIRSWASKEKEIYVVTGPVVKKGYSQIGYVNKVAVPQYYYKVILDYDGRNNKAIGFILPHQGSQQPLSFYAVSVDSVENMTGLDFFPNLPDQEETAIESSAKKWKWSWTD